MKRRTSSICQYKAKNFSFNTDGDLNGNKYQRKHQEKKDAITKEYNCQYWQKTGEYLFMLHVYCQLPDLSSFITSPGVYFIRCRGCLIMIDIKYALIAQTKKHHWSKIQVAKFH